MVLIIHDIALALQAYSTVPLTPETKSTVQESFYNGTWARFGDPQVTVTFHDRADFHARSHYDIRNILDSESMQDDFLVIDEKTPELDAVWLVHPTWFSRYVEKYEQPGEIIHYPNEAFTLWHGHFHTADVPYYFWMWKGECWDIAEDLNNQGYDPYDPHDPQDPPSKIGWDWANPEVPADVFGPAKLTAISGSEVEWSTDISLRGRLDPSFARLTAAAARESGLHQSWSEQSRIVLPGGTVTLFAHYDAHNPKWSTGAASDNSLTTVAGGRARIRPDRRPSLGETLLISPTRQRARYDALHATCRRVKLQRTGKPGETIETDSLYQAKRTSGAGA